MSPSFSSTLSMLFIAATLASSSQAQTLSNANLSTQIVTSSYKSGIKDEIESVKLDSGAPNKDYGILSGFKFEESTGSNAEKSAEDQQVELAGLDESSLAAQQVVGDDLADKSRTMERRLGLFKKNQQQQAPNYQMSAYYSECERCLANAGGPPGGWPAVPTNGPDLPVVARYPMAAPQPLVSEQSASGMMMPLKGKFHGKFQFGKPLMPLFGEPLFGAAHYQAARYRGPIAAGYAGSPFSCIQSGGHLNGHPMVGQEEPSSKGTYSGGPY